MTTARDRNLPASCSTKTLLTIAALLACGLVVWVSTALVSTALAKEYKSGIVWPRPKVIDPGSAGRAPSDAVVLFDGVDMSKWDGGDHWIVSAGIATASGGRVRSKASFGDCQVHLEWASPEKVTGSGQERGNSGVYMMGRYEVQILDSYHNETYFDGQAGSIYKQHPPLVNATRKPGAWQSYDIIFEAPRFDTRGKLTSPAYMTVLHNGVVIQNHFELSGGTAWDSAPKYTAHGPTAPIEIQFHGNPVRFRNIWVRPLAASNDPPALSSELESP